MFVQLLQALLKVGLMSFYGRRKFSGVTAFRDIARNLDAWLCRLPSTHLNLANLARSVAQQA
jgi:hypothetical protein